MPRMGKTGGGRHEPHRRLAAEASVGLREKVHEEVCNVFLGVRTQPNLLHM